MCNNYSDCPVHYRNDADMSAEQDDPFMISYVGEFAIYSLTELSGAPTKEQLIEAKALMTADLLGFDVAEDLARFADSIPRKSVTRVFRVGHGSLSDAFNDSDDVEPVCSISGEVSEMVENHVGAEIAYG